MIKRKSQSVSLLSSIILSICIFALFLSLTGVRAFAAEKKELTIKGSTTVLPIAQACAEVYMKKNPQVSISVQGGGSGVGIASIIDGTADIGDASREIKEKEIKEAEGKGVKPVAHIIAKDGIAVIVNPANKVKELSREQIRAIYTGVISDWEEVGGAKQKIVVISRDSSSGTFEAFEELALSKAKVRPDALLQASNQAVATTVETTPGAIGYVGLGYVSDKVKAVTVDKIECSKKTIISAEYPLARPLFMYTNGKPKELVKNFIDFVLSSEGQALAEENGYVGLK